MVITTALAKQLQPLNTWRYVGGCDMFNGTVSVIVMDTITHEICYTATHQTWMLIEAEIKLSQILAEVRSIYGPIRILREENFIKW